MSERPLRDIARHSFVYGLGSVATSLIGFVLIPVYTRYLTPEDYGTLALVLLFQAVMFRLYDLGLTNSVGRFFFDAKENPRPEGALKVMASTTVLFHAGWAGSLSVVIWLGAPWVSLWLLSDAGGIGLVRVVSVTMFLEAVAITPLTLLRMEERSTLWVLLSVVRITGALGLNILFVVGLGWGVFGVLLSSAIMAGVVLLLVLRELVGRTRLQFDTGVLAEMLRFGLPFLPVSLGVLVIDLSDRFLLDRFRDTTEVGIYSLGYKFGQIMMIAVSAFSMGWAPLRYRILPRSDARDLYARVAAIYWALALMGVVALGVWGTELVWISTTEPFFGAAQVVAPVALAYALYGLSLVTTTGMGVTKKTGGQAVVWTAAAVFNVALNFVVIPRYGMMGAAWTTVVTYIFAVAGTYAFSQRVYRLRFPWDRIAVGAAVAAIIVVVDRVLQPDRETGVGWGLVLGAALMTLFLLTIPLIGLVRWSEIVAAGRWAQQWYPRRTPNS